MTADVKATQIAQDLGLYRDLAQAVSTSNGVQLLLKEYNDGITTQALFDGLNVSAAPLSVPILTSW